MRNKELLFGTILSYVQQIIAVLLGLVYTPFMLSRLGQNEYGLYSTVSATISTLSLLSLGLGAGYIRYYTKYERLRDIEGKSRLNGLFLLIFSALGALALTIGLVVSRNLPLIFKNGLTQEEYAIAGRLAVLLTFSLAISFPATVFDAIISAHERFIVPKSIALLRTLLTHAVTVPLLLLGYKSVAMVTVSLCISCVADIGLVLYVLFELKERFTFSGFEKGLAKGLIIYVMPIALNMLIDQVNLNIDKLLLGRFRGTADVAVYNIGYTLFMMYESVSTAVSSVFTPRIHATVNRLKNEPAGLKRELTGMFTKVGRIQCELLLLVLTGFILFGKSFITVHWAGPEYADSYTVLLLLAIPVTVPLIQNLGIEIQRAENLHRFRSVCYAVMALVNLGLSIFLCQWYGAIGSALGTAVSFVLCNGIIMNIYYHKKCSIDIPTFWKSIFKIILAALPPVAIWLIIGRWFNLSSLPVFCLGVVVYTALYCASMWLLGMNGEEKGIVTGIFASVKTKVLGR